MIPLACYEQSEMKLADLISRSSRSSIGNYEGVHNGFNGGSNTNGHHSNTNSIPSAGVPPRARNSLQPTQEVVGEMIESNGHTALGPTNSLKSVVGKAFYFDILQFVFESKI